MNSRANELPRKGKAFTVYYMAQPGPHPGFVGPEA